MTPVKIPKIQKRDGRVVDFDKNKIINAIFKAITITHQGTFKDAKTVGLKVVSRIETEFINSVPTVEEVQDMVETVLIEEGFDKAAKEYIIYRKKRSDVRDTKRLVGVSDDLKLTINANLVLEKRYLLKNERNEAIETPKKMFMRVAKSIAAGDLKYDPRNVERTEKYFFNIMSNLHFLPNSPTLMNAGTKMPQLSACFVLPIGDSMKEIFDSVRNMAIIHQSGGGTGFSFSNLRPKGDLVKSTNGTASGPVSFMRVFDTAADVIKQGGRRRGANMGILNVDHPDIIEFIRSKSREGNLSNFNLSVAITDDFMKRIENQDLLDLINPRTGKITRSIPSQDILNLMVTMAWSTGDPGVIFIDEINRHNPTPNLGRIESTNPCGEQPLLQYESCNLGSINLSKIVKKSEIDWDLLTDIISISIHFLDNVIDVNRYPLKKIDEISHSNRKIGLGVMGLAEMFIQLEIPYNSNEALHLAEKLMAFISNVSLKKSKAIADARGPFPNFDKSNYKKRGISRIRNATTTTIAPTGTISIVAGCSSGIEPLFAVSFIRNVLEGSKLLEVNPFFEKTVKARGLYSQDLMMEIAKKGSLQNINGVPKDLKNMFITAMDISPEWHVKMQAAFQKYVDNAVSKTVNLPHEASIEDVSDIYHLSHKLKCKGITVYRYGSKTNQVFSLGGSPKLQHSWLNEYVGAEAQYSGGCPHPLCDIY